ncbi:MAG: hypothetical protein M3S32_07155 [Acidobacteriota bacterium]|nr:hypothetical protein [Acidobacteriota bacterium]
MRFLRLAPVLILTMLASGCDERSTFFDQNSKIKLIEISGMVDNAEGSPTILRVGLSLDGREIRSIPLAEASSHIAISASTAGDRGHHTLVIVIADQTSSPVNYRVSGLQVAYVDAFLFGGSGSTLARTVLPDRAELVSSGQGISYSFDL